VTSPPGWYPDPSSSEQRRWWDGQRWTAQVSADPATSPPTAVPPPPPAPGPKQRAPTRGRAWVAGIFGGLLLLGLGVPLGVSLATQPDESERTSSESSDRLETTHGLVEATVFGRFRLEGDGLGDVRLRVLDPNGDYVTATRTDASGAWEVSGRLPAEITVVLDLDSLPDDVVLRDPTRAAQTVVLEEGHRRAVLFATESMLTDDLDDRGQAGQCPPPHDAPEVDADRYDEPPPAELDLQATYLATIETTCGRIVLELDAVGAPMATSNFVFLAREGFYDGVGFHRVVEGFMIQGGDPEGTGTGGPGYTFGDELGPAEAHFQEVRRRLESEGDLGPNGVRGGYERGRLAMANAGPDTNGSQFFITQGDPTVLPEPAYTLFGKVVSGMDVVDRIANDPAEGELAVEPVRIIGIDIEER
jgi:cyclophilin family peptidyl-prolyl cis-trans isomerase